MQKSHWKRLADTEQHFRFVTRQVVVMRRDESETDSDIDAKIRRWKAGEKVDGIDAHYEGGELTIVSVRGVSPCRRAISLD